jgi:hypothetical protein
MKFKGTVLLLDNFRSVLSDYSLDIQDVVRSAILDGVDISHYIPLCAEDPYKLDQVRLALKERIPFSDFNVFGGDHLYAIRQLIRKGYNVEPIVSQITSGRLSEEYVGYLLSWVSKGIDVRGIKLSLIPKKMLEIFDMHISQGRDIRPFINGQVYSQEYILYCMSIQSTGKDISVFASKKWNEDVLSYLSSISKDMGTGSWSTLMGVISEQDDLNRVTTLVTAYKLKLPLDELGKRLHSGSAAYATDVLVLICDLARVGLPYKDLMTPGISVEAASSKAEEIKMVSGRRLSGTLRYSNRR